MNWYLKYIGATKVGRAVFYDGLKREERVLYFDKNNKRYCVVFDHKVFTFRPHRYIADENLVYGSI